MCVWGGMGCTAGTPSEIKIAVYFFILILNILVWTPVAKSAVTERQTENTHTHRDLSTLDTIDRRSL